MLYMFYMVKKCKGGKVVGDGMENRRYRRLAYGLSCLSCSTCLTTA